MGDSAASAVEVDGRLVLPDGRAEHARAQLEHVPAGAARELGLVFRSDPARGELTTSVVGFRLP